MVLVVVNPLAAVPVFLPHVVALLPLIVAHIVSMGLMIIMVVIAMIIMMVLRERDRNSQARSERGSGKQACNTFHKTSPWPC